MAQLFLVIILLVATFTYLPESFICKLDDSCNTIQSVTIPKNSMENEINKVVADTINDNFRLFGDTLTKTVKTVISGTSEEKE